MVKSISSSNVRKSGDWTDKFLSDPDPERLQEHIKRLRIRIEELEDLNQKLADEKKALEERLENNGQDTGLVMPSVNVDGMTRKQIIKEFVARNPFGVTLSDVNMVSGGLTKSGWKKLLNGGESR